MYTRRHPAISVEPNCSKENTMSTFSFIKNLFTSRKASTEVPAEVKPQEQPVPTIIKAVQVDATEGEREMLEKEIWEHLTELKKKDLVVELIKTNGIMQISITHPRSFIEGICTVEIISEKRFTTTVFKYNYTDNDPDSCDEDELDDFEWLTSEDIAEIAKHTELILGEEYGMDGEEIAGVIEDWRK